MIRRPRERQRAISMKEILEFAPPPRPEQPLPCGDWDCPARISCAHHHGRSKPDAQRIEAETKNYDRQMSANACDDYAFDQPNAWLM